jgi:hypothetical protein
VRRRFMRASLAVVLASVVALGLSAPASGKGFTRVVLVASDGRSFSLVAREATVDGLLSKRGSREPIRSGYVRLFFVGLGGFPVAPARYYPAQGCVALDWPRYETSCAHVDGKLIQLLRPLAGVPRFVTRPTVLARIAYLGEFRGMIETAAALASPIELAFDRLGRQATRPRGCYSFNGRWRGPSASLRPRRFDLCAQGVYADGRLYPLPRGVWAWFRLNV